MFLFYFKLHCSLLNKLLLRFQDGFFLLLALLEPAQTVFCLTGTSSYLVAISYFKTNATLYSISHYTHRDS